MSTETESSTPATEVVAGAYFTHDDGGVRLRITECHTCHSRWFPPVSICSHCAGTDVADIESGPTGVAYASTVVRVGPPGFPAPYVLSYVDIDGVRLLAHTAADAALTPDTTVRLELGEIGDRNGTTLLSYVARPLPHDINAPTEGGQQ
ncbi:Zn-ribbon domain-containing OB-fold protein [Nocardia harenae]|uniref:Zn-ribbon domain-containing OB-fold protein n=1 Tax=Nocardia harenae TaxID=358707 RepID=UPI000A568BEA|nr:OB-fold domain-containing protein [Nocardia harenae]